MSHALSLRVALCLAVALAAGCDDDPTPADGSDATAAADGAAAPDAAGSDATGSDADPADAGPADAAPPRDGAPPHDGVFAFAGGCYAVEGYAGGAVHLLTATEDGAGFEFTQGEGPSGEGARFHMRPSDLGTYLLYDADRRFLVAEPDGDGWRFARPAQLESNLTLYDDSFQSPAEWIPQPSAQDPARFQLQHRASGAWLALDGLSADAAGAAVIAFYPREGCAAFPELSVDAVGEPAPRTWPDGDLYGIAEVHSHMMTNTGFGGSGMFHGAPFHRLGVEHALADCSLDHGEEGRRDLVGLFYDANDDAGDIAAYLPVLLAGQSNEFNHFTDGYPTFTEWPNAWRRATHQTMYYRWLERAWRAGLRLVVQHATGNSVLCEFGIGVGAQTARYSCNDMVTVDQSIKAVRELERYIDAQAGGPGLGWLRVVGSPAEAREVIASGKLAIVLGIEISNLFDCFLTPPAGTERCTLETVREALDEYYALGVRVVFPVHKFDNGFGPGDGHGGIIELGNFINSGHYTSKIEDCPLGRQGFDGGSLTFSGLNQPRETFDAPPVADLSGFLGDPVGTLRPYFGVLLAGGAEGNFCQNFGITDLGETLLHELMLRGMIPDIAHLPQRTLTRALEILQASDYPALSTHGNTHGGALLPLGGMTAAGPGGCGNPDQPGAMIRRVTERSQARAEAGAHPGVPLGFDLNGFAGARRPRFGDDAGCGQPQANPVTYPFLSYDGEVEFQPPTLGERPVDFNTEGFLHIGLLPELIEDTRRDGATDDDLAPLFRSAETVVRMWERAELRAAELAAE